MSQIPSVLSPYNYTNSTPIAFKSKHWVCRILMIIGCIIVALLVIIPNLPRILNIFNHDIDPIDDSDLALQEINLSDSVNGYNDLAKAIDVMYAPADMASAISDMAIGKNWNDTKAADLVLKNTKAFALFDQAAHSKQFQPPLTADPVNINSAMILTPMNDWRTISRLSSIYAIALSKQGKDKLALEVAFDSIRLGQKVMDSQNVLIGYLVGINMKIIGLSSIQQIISTSKLSVKEMSPYIKELSQYTNNEAGLATAFKAEYYIQTTWLGPDRIKAMVLSDFSFQDANTPQGSLNGMTPNEYVEKASNSYYFQPNKTRLLFANNTRTIIKNITNSCGLTPQLKIQRTAPTSYIGIYLEPNVIGEVLHDVMASSLDGVNRVKCEDQARVGETQILLAIKAYKNDTKSLPNSIDQLVPAYLSAKPIDPFSKQPLQYSLTSKTIYSSYSTSTLSFDF